MILAKDLKIDDTVTLHGKTYTVIETIHDSHIFLVNLESDTYDGFHIFYDCEYDCESNGPHIFNNCDVNVKYANEFGIKVNE